MMTRGVLLAASCALLVLIAASCGDDDPVGRDGKPAGDASPSGDGGGDDALGCDNPQTYYPDGDGDSWGSAIGQSVQACSQPSGYVTNKVDCGDGDNNAFPGQTQFFDVPIRGETGNEWDYNCDGTAEPQVIYNDVLICDNKGYTICETNFEPSWWGTKPPACGETRKILVSCTLNGSPLNFTCDPNFSGEKKQTCR